MDQARTLLLFDPDVQPSSWNERMSPGEYAVHGSNFEPGAEPSCTVLGSLAEAEAFARRQVLMRPQGRCRIYDHQGYVGAALVEIRGESYKAEPEMTPRFRRWFGAFLFFGGLVLVTVDWLLDFRLTWASMLGSRMMIPGVVLLFIEAMVLLTAWEKTRRLRKGHA